LEVLVPVDLQDKLERKAKRDRLVVLVHQVEQVQLVQRESEVKLDHQVQLDPKDHVVQLDQQDQLDPEVILELQEHLVIVVSQETLVQLGHLDQLDHVEKEERVVTRDRKETRDSKVELV
jgi:hypothetical protein